MDIKDYLKEYAARADVHLSNLFEEKKREVSHIGKKGSVTNSNVLAVDMLTKYQAFSRGGKKLRGALIQLGYEMVKGTKEEVLEASVCIEIIHSFLLMHDDIEDRDLIRRGSPTIHFQYESEHKEVNSASDSKHFGISMGINLGDLGAYLGMESLLNSKVNNKNKLQAALFLSRLLQQVAYGQGLDVTYEQMQNITEDDVLEVHLFKTGIYTISGPLKIGALLGGAKKSVLNAIDKFGEPVGIAYQLRDDELGLFSNEVELGKPIGGDVREGKNTLLKIKAIENSNARDAKFLKYAYGNPEITNNDVNRVRKITIDSGALAYSQKLSKNLVREGKLHIPKITKDKKYQSMLSSIADFLIDRNS